ncbi:MAG TPA: CotH kinase family protein, partial [Limosilactobacillus pontis]|nr:CotH kinase family protein [Limosilactobacillus pontis]
SAIDYWIFCHLIDDGDAFGKNQQLLTYDNKKFFIHPYDLDTSYGNQYDGSLTGGHDSFFVPESLLFKRLDSLFASDLKKRYTELRSWLTPTYVINQYRQWVDSIGEDNYEKEYEKWKNNKSDFNYLKSQVMKAFKVCDDAWF